MILFFYMKDQELDCNSSFAPFKDKISWWQNSPLTITKSFRLSTATVLEGWSKFWMIELANLAHRMNQTELNLPKWLVLFSSLFSRQLPRWITSTFEPKVLMHQHAYYELMTWSNRKLKKKKSDQLLDRSSISSHNNIFECKFSINLLND